MRQNIIFIFLYLIKLRMALLKGIKIGDKKMGKLWMFCLLSMDALNIR